MPETPRQDCVFGLFVRDRNISPDTVAVASRNPSWPKSVTVEIPNLGRVATKEDLARAWSRMPWISGWSLAGEFDTPAQTNKALSLWYGEMNSDRKEYTDTFRSEHEAVFKVPRERACDIASGFPNGELTRHQVSPLILAMKKRTYRTVHQFLRLIYPGTPHGEYQQLVTEPGSMFLTRALSAYDTAGNPSLRHEILNGFFWVTENAQRASACPNAVVHPGLVLAADLTYGALRALPDSTQMSFRSDLGRALRATRCWEELSQKSMPVEWIHRLVRNKTGVELRGEDVQRLKALSAPSTGEQETPTLATVLISRLSEAYDFDSYAIAHRLFPRVVTMERWRVP